LNDDTTFILVFAPLIDNVHYSLHVMYSAVKVPTVFHPTTSAAN